MGTFWFEKRWGEERFIGYFNPESIFSVNYKNAFQEGLSVLFKMLIFFFGFFSGTFSAREVERPQKEGTYIKLKRPCREVFKDPSKLHVPFGGIVVGRFKCEKHDLKS